MIPLLAALIAQASVREAAQLEVTLWHSYNGPERDALEAVVRAFEATSPGFRVAPSMVPYDALADKLTAAIPRGHGPDVFIFAHDRIGGWAEGGQIEPIELLVDEAMLDAHETDCVFALAYGDALYGLPLAHKALALYVRTDLAPEPPEDFASLLALAKKHTDAAKARYGLVYGNIDFFYHTPILFSLGGVVFEGADPRRGIAGKVAVRNDGMKRSLAMAHRLAKTEGLIPDDPTQVTASAMFAEGRTPMLISGPWFRSQIDRAVPYTVVPIPAFEGGARASGFSTCEAVLMSKRTKHPKEAFRFLSFLANDPTSAELRMRAGGQPVTLRSAWETVLPTLDAKEQRIFSAFRDAFASSVPSPSNPEMAAVWTPMNAALYKTIHQGMDPSQALAEAQERISRALSALGK